MYMYMYIPLLIPFLASSPSLPFSLPPSLSCRAWMDGPMSEVDPDQVENDVSAFWRTLYKQEKTLSEFPNPVKMAQKVCAHLTYVRIYMY